MIVRWNPWNEMSRLQREMNDLFDSRRRGEEDGAAIEAAWQPEVDVYEDPERFILSADLPGMSPDGVQVNVENNRLFLRGERILPFESTKENYHRIERSYGKFGRTFTLPDSVDGDKIQAEYKNGILNVTIPKRPEEQPRTISVKVTE